MVGRPGNEANYIWLVRLLYRLTVLSYKLPPSQRGKVWSCCNHEVVAKDCNYLTQWSNNNKMPTSTKHIVMQLYSTTQMQAMKSTDLIGHIKVLPW